MRSRTPPARWPRRWRRSSDPRHARGLARVAELAGELEAERVVVGLPLTLAGEEGQQAATARQFAERLGARLTVPVELYDERLTTRMADATAGRAGRRLARRGAPARELPGGAGRGLSPMTPEPLAGGARAGPPGARGSARPARRRRPAARHAPVPATPAARRAEPPRPPAPYPSEPAPEPEPSEPPPRREPTQGRAAAARSAAARRLMERRRAVGTEAPPARRRGRRGLAAAAVGGVVAVVLAYLALSLFQPFKGEGEGEVQVRIPRGAGRGPDRRRAGGAGGDRQRVLLRGARHRLGAPRATSRPAPSGSGRT